MANHRNMVLKRAHRRVAMIIFGPSALAFLPALSLAAFWLGGEQALLAVAAGLPLVYLVCGGFGGELNQFSLPRDAYTGLLQRAGFEELTESVYERAEELGWHSATFFVGLEEFDQLVERYGQAAADTVVLRTGERLIGVLRDNDAVGQMGDARFAICLDPVRQLDLELCIQLAGRLQVAVEEAVSVDGIAIYVSASIGFCQRSRSPGKTGAAWLQAASTALREAQRRGPSAIRAFSDQMRRDNESRAELREEVAQALEAGHIQPWFQPQISTDTGQDHRV